MRKLFDSFPCSFLVTWSVLWSRTLKGLFELTRRPWRALNLELQGNMDTVRCEALGTHVPEHRQEQLINKNECLIENTCIYPKGGSGPLVQPPDLHYTQPSCSRFCGFAASKMHKARSILSLSLYPQHSHHVVVCNFPSGHMLLLLLHLLYSAVCVYIQEK